MFYKLIIGILILCLVWFLETFGTKLIPSKPQTCEDVIAHHIQNQLNLCRQVEYELSRYGRVPQSLKSEKIDYYYRVVLYLDKNFGSECSKKWHKAVYVDNDCPFRI